MQGLDKGAFAGGGEGGFGEAEGGVEFVEGADGFDLGVVFGDALAVEQRGVPVVACAGGDGADGWGVFRHDGLIFSARRGFVF